ncbi:hypothetical protein O6H91_04G117000 [Diphasiastrum complanatum]|uniref:Uncharacterized protein n=2 Tax=Diphasiastrum complanatum TaxID=34168 RepID=A0ACC2E132_DIPCM|nr:hypothetical protein O6H91_24G000100 [Diphasiastrum complanatum]KAJ7560172.1 hypothetical protein O6H91_04G117000 [Diphasiastrum complanatum]
MGCRNLRCFHLIQFLYMIASLERMIYCLSPDGAALLSMKVSIVDPLGRLNDWLQSDSSPCLWTGVRCDDSDNVIAVDLSNMQLSGNVSGAIGRLTNLVNITVEQNNFTGSLPREITHISGLRFLNISHNNFSYNFPSNFSNLQQLGVLDAYNNNFSGPLPIQISQLPNLVHFHLGGSYFEGNIPPEYGNMSKLQYLALSGNSLTGRIPAEIGNLSSLEQLYLGYYNVFEGGIPPEIGKLSKLVRLDMSSCGLTGPIPPQIGNLSHLDTLFLQINELGGSIPKELGNLINVRSLDLSNNNLEGKIPEELQNLQSVELLSLFLNHLEGGIPLYLAEMPSLQALFLWSNNLTGVIPQMLGTNGNLTQLDLSSNALVGPIPPGLCTGGKLVVLVLLKNQLSGALPEDLGYCKTLNHVRLGNNQLSGAIPKGMLSLKNLQMLELVSNQFNGSLPADIDAPLLQFLDVSDSELSGELPPSIGKLPNLQKLFLSKNRLVGSMPPEMSNLRSLSYLDLSENHLSGPIPAELGRCDQLFYLDLSVNDLEGEIPAGLQGLQVLGFLNVSRNHLTGRIPPALNLLQSLTSADFSHNNLSGPVPTNGLFQYLNASSFEGNPGLCGHGISPCSHSDDRSLPDSGETKRAKRFRAGLKAIVTVVVVAVFIILALLVSFIHNHKEQLCDMCKEQPSKRPWKLTAFQRLDFDCHHVLDCLHESNIIGKGGNGVVYRADMPNGETVAVKRLKKGGHMGGSDDHGFSAEIQTLGKIRHRNIVKLLGCCSDGEINLLIYEYMPNGSLGELLHGKRSEMLDWKTRYNIAVQAANGLCYLHHDCFPLIVHRDVKSNNILLDSNFEAHVADFGLAKSFQDSGKSESMSSVAGSWGYIAPEYAYTLKVNEKSDIYSFGVVLLELITGKRPNEPGFTADGLDIVHWVRSRYLNEDQGLMQILDPRMLCSELPLNEVVAMVGVALICCSIHPVERPTMRDVVQMLADVKPKSRGGSFKDNARIERPLISL